MRSTTFDVSRRQALLCGSGAVAGLVTALHPTTAHAQPALKPLRVAQLLDTAPDQQELSRDYSTGVRLAAAEAGRSGGRTLQLVSIETDGSPESLTRALRSVKDDPTQLALLGTVGEKLALASVASARAIGLDISHIAPWMADTRFDTNDQVFSLFASRETQIQRALQSLTTVGIKELGLVYASPGLEQILQPGITPITEKLKLRTPRYTVPAGQDMAAFGATLPSTSPAVLLFLGGTVELALFSQGLSRQRLQRYVVCLSDVDVTTLMQLGPGKAVPLIFTQVVPNPQSSNLPLVRDYRALLKAYFDEPPSPVSLAGYIAGRYAVQALARIDATASRTAVLGELQRRTAIDLGGIRIDFARDGRGSSFVNQTMLQGNGRLIG